MRCSCGCGRKVGLRDHRADARAKLARRLVTEMEALSFSSDPDEYRRAYLFEGESWRNQYTRVVHGELTRKQIREEARWAAWLGGAAPAVKEARREQARTPAPSPSPAPSPAPSPSPGADLSESPDIRVPRADNKPPLDAALAAEAAPSEGSEALARRIRVAIAGHEGVTEDEMFGSAAWLVNGNPACGTVGDALLVRVDRGERDRLLAEEHVRPMSRKGRTITGFVTVDSAAIADDAELARWIDMAAGYAAWLPPKEPGRARA